MNNDLTECGGTQAPAGDRKVYVSIGGHFYEVREADVIEQIKKTYQHSGFVVAMRLYHHLFPDVEYSEAKEIVTGWCGNLKEGSVMLVT